MYGMNKDKDSKKKFLFNLEMEVKDNPKYGKELLEKADHTISELKGSLRTGASEKEFDRLGILLHAYTAFQKVMKKVVKQ